MKLDRTLPPDDDAISAVFACPNCGASFAMHTNSMETQLVRSLGVKIGSEATDRQPMEMIRGSLAGAKEIETPHVESMTNDSESTQSGGKCPFTGTVTEAYANEAPNSGPPWTEAAEARLERVPSFIRSMVKKGIEDVAKQKGYAEVTEEVMQEVRGEIGM